MPRRPQNQCKWCPNERWEYSDICWDCHLANSQLPEMFEIHRDYSMYGSMAFFDIKGRIEAPWRISIFEAIKRGLIAKGSFDALSVKYSIDGNPHRTAYLAAQICLRYLRRIKYTEFDSRRMYTFFRKIFDRFNAKEKFRYSHGRAGLYDIIRSRTFGFTESDNINFVFLNGEKIVHAGNSYYKCDKEGNIIIPHKEISSSLIEEEFRKLELENSNRKKAKADADFLAKRINEMSRLISQLEAL